MRLGRGGRKSGILPLSIGASSNGRTEDFESSYLGSNPSAPENSALIEISAELAGRIIQSFRLFLCGISPAFPSADQRLGSATDGAPES